MYKIVGADGKEYGPVTLEQIQKWIVEGRVNAQTRVQAAGSAEWKTLADFPELKASLPGRPVPPGTPIPAPLSSGAPAGQTQGLAVTSLILGILSMLGCVFFTAIPAVICGHIARSRALSSPERYGGAGLALGGLITGYIGLAFSLLVLPAAMLLPALGKAKERAQSINCVNNMKQIGLSFRQWSVDNKDLFPWQVSVTNGGTMELAIQGADNIDPNPIHFEVLSNELNTTRILICPGDTTKTAAFKFQNLKAYNVSYQLHSGSNVSDAFPNQVLAICPIHGHVLTCDGAVQSKRPSRRRVY